MLEIFGEHEGDALEHGYGEYLSIPQRHAVFCNSLKSALKHLQCNWYDIRTSCQTIYFCNGFVMGEWYSEFPSYRPIELR